MTKPSSDATRQPQRNGTAPARLRAPLLLVAGGDAAPAAAVLESLLAEVAPDLAVLRHDTLADALADAGAGADDPPRLILMPVLMPLDHLTRGLAGGLGPDAALAAWSTGADALLKQCRKARRRMVLVDAGAVHDDPGAVLAAMAERLGLSMPPARADMAETHPETPAARAGNADGKTTTPDTPFPAAVMAAIGASILAQDSPARDLADELEAMVLGPVTPRVPPRDGLGPAVAAMRDQAEALSRVTEERDLLRENATRLQKESAQQAEALSRLTEERDLLRESLAQMQAQNDQLSLELADRTEQALLQAQVEALGRQLDEVQDLRMQREAVLGAEILALGDRARARDALAVSLAEANGRAMQQAQEARQLAAELAEARAHIDALHASTSWKVTKPIRAVKQGLRRP